MENKKNNDRVTVYVPKGYVNEESNLFVSVNGMNFLLPRGKSSSVPGFVARELERSRKAQELLDQRKSDMLDAARQ